MQYSLGHSEPLTASEDMHAQMLQSQVYCHRTVPSSWCTSAKRNVPTTTFETPLQLAEHVQSRQCSLVLLQICVPSCAVATTAVPLKHLLKLVPAIVVLTYLKDVLVHILGLPSSLYFAWLEWYLWPWLHSCHNPFFPSTLSLSCKGQLFSQCHPTYMVTRHEKCSYGVLCLHGSQYIAMCNSKLALLHHGSDRGIS